MSLYIGNKKIAGLVRGEDISHATEEHAGIVELATQEEVIQGSDDLKAVTSLKLNKKLEEIVGLLSDLQTENKTNIVNAINEINSKTGSNYTYPLLCINEEGQFADDSEEYSGWNEGLFKGMLEEIVYHEGEVLPKDVCGAYFIEGSLAKYFASDMIDFSIENMTAEVTTKVKLDTELYGSKAFQLNKIKATFTTDDDAQEVTITSLEVSHELIYVGGSQPSLSINNIDAYTPESDYNPATKKYVDDEIKELPMADLIHYQGHVGSIDDLPSTGQESGIAINTPQQIISAFLKILTGTRFPNDTLAITNFENKKSGYNYYIGFAGTFSYADDWTYYAGIYFNDPKQILGMTIYSGYYTIFTVDASAEKPIFIKHFGKEDWTSRIYTAVTHEDGTVIYEGSTYNGSTYTLTQPGIIAMRNTGTNATDRAGLFSNTGMTLKYKSIDKFGIYNGSINTNGNTKSAFCYYDTTQNYFYNDDMNFLAFDLETKHGKLVKQEPSPLCIENNAYTVGDTYDLYVCDSTPKWNHWSKVDLENYYNKQEVDDKFKDVELFKFPNATIIGEPTINNGQISDFTSQDYLQFPFIVDFKGRPFTINACFTTTEDVTTQQNIFDSLFGFAFAIQNSHFVLAMSSDGTSWDIGVETGSYEVLPNTTYYVKISWDGTRYTLSYSLDKQEYIDDIVKESELSLYPKQVIIGVGDLGKEVPKVFSGIINMNYCDLIISDKLVWSGMDSVGIASRADVSLSNLDEAGKQVIRDLAETLPTIPAHYSEEEDATIIYKSDLIEGKYLYRPIDDDGSSDGIMILSEGFEQSRLIYYTEAAILILWEEWDGSSYTGRYIGTMDGFFEMPDAYMIELLNNNRDKLKEILEGSTIPTIQMDITDEENKIPAERIDEKQNFYILNGHFESEQQDMILGTITVTRDNEGNPISLYASLTDGSSAVMLLNPETNAFEIDIDSEEGAENFFTMNTKKDRELLEHLGNVSSKLINYQGHLNSVEELPSTGQPSGDEVLPTYVMSQDDINHLCVTTDNKDNVRALQSYSGMQYVAGGVDNNTTKHGLASNYIDVFDKIYVQKYYDSLRIAIHANASEDKPVKAFRNYYAGGFNVYFDDGTKASIDSYSGTFTKPLWMVIGYYSPSSSKDFFYGNITHALKFDHPISSNLDYIWAGFTNSKLNTVALLSIDNYKYNVGMNFAKFNDLGNLELFTNEPSPLAIENNAYTVGDNYDIYVCDDKPRWNLWSATVSATEEDIDNIITGEEGV